MAEGIIQKAGGGAASDECTAAKAQVLSGYTAVTSDSNDEPAAGAMANQGAKTAALNCGGSYTIPAGYHNGSGKVTANSLASQTAGNLAANKIIKGYYGWSNGVKVEGGITISSVVSFSAAAYSTSQVLCTWKNPAKGPYSGVAICAKTGGYPTGINDNRKYTGVGTNSALNGTSTAIIGSLTAGTTYYFRIWVYCTCSAGDLYSGYLQAACAPTSHGRQAYTSSNTFTVPANVRSINIHCTGGGSAGRSEYTSDANTAGGGGGGYTSYKNGIPATPNEYLTITVGSGGKASTNTSAESGGSSSVSRGNTILVSANGSQLTSSYYKGVDGGSGGGGGANKSSGTGGAGGSDGGAGSSGITDGRSGGAGQGTSTKEFGIGTLYSGAGGGGTGRYGGNVPSSGGSGGGGNGSTRATDPVNGTAGSGGGGGGGGGKGQGGADTYGRGADGGSGNVIITW